VGPAEFKIKIKSKTAPKLIRSKHYHPSLEKFEIKYQEVWIELGSKLCHCSFFIFEMEFELKTGNQKVLIYFEFQLGYLENSKTLQAWPIILLLHLVQFKIISRV
jgi:hypothetical protein